MTTKKNHIYIEDKRLHAFSPHRTPFEAISRWICIRQSAESICLKHFYTLHYNDTRWGLLTLARHWSPGLSIKLPNFSQGYSTATERPVVQSEIKTERVKNDEWVLLFYFYFVAFAEQGEKKLIIPQGVLNSAHLLNPSWSTSLATCVSPGFHPWAAGAAAEA